MKEKRVKVKGQGESKVEEVEEAWEEELKEKINNWLGF